MIIAKNIKTKPDFKGEKVWRIYLHTCFFKTAFVKCWKVFKFTICCDKIVLAIYKKRFVFKGKNVANLIKIAKMLF